jgi:hypothetical protein
MRRRLKVEWIEGEPLRALVESQREGIPPYLIDLGGLDGSMICSCPHWEFSIYPQIRAQLHLPWYERRTICCIHLYEARESLANQVIHLISEKINQPGEPAIIGRGIPPEEDKSNWKNFWFQRFFHWRGNEEKK